MRRSVNLENLEKFMQRLGAEAKGPGTVYLTGGSTALLLGIRQQTIDVDIKLDPEPIGVFAQIQNLKEELNLNVELAAPDQFIPALPGWKDRSLLIKRVGKVEFRHYDFYAQLLSKLERGHDQDLLDVQALVDRGHVNKIELLKLFIKIIPDLQRFPAIDATEFERRVKEFVNDSK